jgi:hypothetical protein
VCWVGGFGKDQAESSRRTDKWRGGRELVLRRTRVWKVEETGWLTILLMGVKEFLFQPRLT